MLKKILSLVSLPVLALTFSACPGNSDPMSGGNFACLLTEMPENPEAPGDTVCSEYLGEFYTEQVVRITCEGAGGTVRTACPLTGVMGVCSVRPSPSGTTDYDVYSYLGGSRTAEEAEAECVAGGNTWMSRESDGI
jgi:hypothetical protein